MIPQILPLVWTGAAGLLVGALVAIVLVRVLLRREGGSGVREIVRAIDDLAEGRPEHLPQADPDEPLSRVHAALSRLSQALMERQAEQEKRSAAIQSLLDGAAGIGFAGTDAAGDIVLWSSGAREITGYAIEEVRGRPLERIFTPGTWAALSPKLDRRDPAGGRVTAGSLPGADAALQRRGGGEVPVDLTISLLDRGGPVGTLVSFQDRTERDRVDAELRASDERLRRVFEGLPDGAFLAQDGLVLIASPSLGVLLDVPPAAVTGRPFVEWIASEDLLRVRSHLERAQKGESIPEERVRIAPGSGAPSAPAATPAGPKTALLSLRGCIVSGERAVTGTLRLADRVQEDLRETRGNESLLDATVEAAADGLLVMAGPAGDRRVRVVNARLGELLGLAGASLQHRDARTIMTLLGGRFRDPEEFASFFEALDADDVRNERRAFELAGAQPARFLEVYTTPARDEAGRAMGRAWAFRDVTAALALTRSRDELEEACRRLEAVNARLAQRSGELDRVNGELQALDRMKSDLLANVSHELQTPLTAIKGYTELILKGKLGNVTNEQRRGLEVSQRNADRLIVMIENLLSLARTEKDLPAMRAITFPLWDLIEECVELVRESADRRHLSISTRYLTEDLGVRGDREKISQVFLNLLSNAVKFSSEGGEIALTVRKGKQGFLIVEVRDTGIGIPVDDLEKIFDRFYRAHETGPHSDREGSGIGLTIVRDILRLHGCTIKADSRPGEGAVFTFSLPQAGAESALQGAPDAAPSSGATGPSGDAPPGSKTPGGDGSQRPERSDAAGRAESAGRPGPSGPADAPGLPGDWPGFREFPDLR